MTTKEQQTIDQLLKSINDLRTENNFFKATVNQQVQAINEKVDAKHLPISLEHDVANVIQSAIHKGLSDALSNSYNSPLVLYAQNSIAKYQTQIEKLFEDAISEGIQTDDFKKSVKDVLINKMAKRMLSGIDGATEKTINLMKQDAVFRSRLTLAINGLIEEFINR